MELRIDRGIKSYDVFDADGVKAGTLRLNLADPALVGRWGELENYINTLDVHNITMADTVKLDAEVKSKLDYALGGNASEVLFAGMSCLALCDDGQIVMEHVLEALTPVIEEAQTTAAKTAEQRIKQRTAAYEGSDAGLAPGQQA